MCCGSSLKLPTPLWDKSKELLDTTALSPPINLCTLQQTPRTQQPQQPTSSHPACPQTGNETVVVRLLHHAATCPTITELTKAMQVTKTETAEAATGSETGPAEKTPAHGALPVATCATDPQDGKSRPIANFLFRLKNFHTDNLF
jgi:hypothetical protein